MAFRSEKAIGALALFLSLGIRAASEQPSIPVQHRHLRNGAPGDLKIVDSTLVFREVGKHNDHSREWAFDDIQQLYISPAQVQILTYEDVSWKLGKDRTYKFDHLPEHAAERILALVRDRIDWLRLVLAMPDPNLQPLWQIKAKLVDGWGGSEGIVLAGDAAIVYSSAEAGASRTWHFRQIENVSSSGPFDLTVTAFESSGGAVTGTRDYRFQLKTELTGARYNDLWRRINANH